MRTKRSDTKRFVLFLIIVSAIGGVLYGYDLGIISGAMAFMNKDIAMSNTQLHMMPGAVLFGGAFATLITGPLCDWYGRRKMIIAAAVVFLFGVLIITTATNFTELLAGRLIQGLGVGVVTIAIPLYLAEAVPPAIRGEAICTFQLLLTAGILLSSLVGLYFTQGGNWRAMFCSALAPGILLLVGGCLLPESPRWLCLQGEYKKAMTALRKSRSEEAAERELNQMQISIQNSLSKTNGSIRLWQKQFSKPLLIVLTVACLGQLTGINSFLQLAPTILKSAGLGSDMIAMIGNSAITGLNFIITIVALLLIDRLGRRFLLCLGTCGIIVALAYSGAVFYFMPTSELKGVLLLSGILGFIFFFAIGPGVVIWMVISELLPLRIRSSGMAVALFLNSMTSAILATVFLGLAEKIGYYGVFWLCAFFTLLYFLTVFFFVPETKNKTLEEIEGHFQEV
ncbi:MAG: sugar porter family MFS transporter [Proteobacteria bacterium]|nr:sugar porter family MFS transporter [Pseudomonadota bacterium]